MAILLTTLIRTLDRPNFEAPSDNEMPILFVAPNVKFAGIVFVGIT